jgi:hypothetical protein
MAPGNIGARMKHIDTNQKLLHSKPNIDRAMYDGKTVEFIFDQGIALLLLTGRFVFQSRPNYERIDVLYTGRLDPLDPPQASYVFQLYQAHLASTVPAGKPGAKVDFLMERPLWRRDCLNQAFAESNREPGFSWIVSLTQKPAFGGQE